MRYVLNLGRNDCCTLKCLGKEQWKLASRGMLDGMGRGSREASGECGRTLSLEALLRWDSEAIGLSVFFLLARAGKQRQSGTHIQRELPGDVCIGNLICKLLERKLSIPARKSVARHCGLVPRGVLTHALRVLHAPVLVCLHDGLVDDLL